MFGRAKCWINNPLRLSLPLDACKLIHISFSNVWFQKIPIPPPWKVTESSRGVGGLEVQISKGCGDEKSNIFPEGPRVLSERNLPISHLQFDKSRNQ